MEKIDPNKFYFCIVCTNCQQSVPFAEAPTPEECSDTRSRGIELVSAGPGCLNSFPRMISGVPPGCFR
jgi:hypothetical protein